MAKRNRRRAPQLAISNIDTIVHKASEWFPPGYTVVIAFGADSGTQGRYGLRLLREGKPLPWEPTRSESVAAAIREAAVYARAVVAAAGADGAVFTPPAP